jgi:DNA mismatch repair ATPase MutS
VANALAQSTDHIFGFFEVLRAELGFYVGCLNLHAALTSLDVPVCLPDAKDGGTAALRFRGLCDPCLALSLRRSLVGNSVDASGRDLVVVTGASQGGKSTFLRSLGLAQLMMQAGMFVAAESSEGAVCTALFTHFRREEDATMTSGKLEEELSRMSDIVDDLSPGAVVLFNESFSSTNEREGSEIAWQVIRALVDSGVRVHFVTHLHAFARRAFDRRDEGALFLRAERNQDGTRTFRMIEGEPEKTSHGSDLYRQVFDVETEEAQVP